MFAGSHPQAERPRPQPRSGHQRPRHDRRAGSSKARISVFWYWSSGRRTHAVYPRILITSRCQICEFVLLGGGKYLVGPRPWTCASLHPVQVLQWTMQSSQDRPVTGRQALQLRQSAGDAQVERRLKLDSGQPEEASHQLWRQHRKAPDNLEITSDFCPHPQLWLKDTKVNEAVKTCSQQESFHKL